MNYSCRISSNNSFSTFLPFILFTLFAVALSGCDSPAGSTSDNNDLNTQAKSFEFNETDIIYRTLGGGYYGSGSSNAINNQGLAAGDESFSDEEAYGIVWGKDTSRTVGGYYDGYAYSFAEDINDKGQVVGHDNFDAILWEGNTRTELGDLGGDQTLPQAINENAQVVGYGRIENGLYATEHAFLWENGTITDLGTLCNKNVESQALAINELGQIVGWSETKQGETHAFFWEDGKMTDIGTKGKNTSAVDINDSGQIIIYKGDYKSTLLDNGNKIDLNFGVSSINNKGQILGFTEDERYVIWENGTTTDITFEPDFERGESNLRSMSDLNDVGQVTGTAVNIISTCDPEDFGPECRDSGDYDVRDNGFILNTGL